MCRQPLAYRVVNDLVDARLHNGVIDCLRDLVEIVEELRSDMGDLDRRFDTDIDCGCDKLSDEISRLKSRVEDLEREG